MVRIVGAVVLVVVMFALLGYEAERQPIDQPDRVVSEQAETARQGWQEAAGGSAGEAYRQRLRAIDPALGGKRVLGMAIATCADIADITDDAPFMETARHRYAAATPTLPTRAEARAIVASTRALICPTLH